MSSEQRAFRGVWIPASLWLNNELSLQEKVMLVEIDSLQDPKRGCWKSNSKFGEFFNLSANRVSEIVSGLAKKGWIRVEQIRDGKQCVERRIYMANPLEKPITPTRDPEGGYSESRENPTRDPEGGYSESREERGSGLGVQLEGSSKSYSPGSEPPVKDEIEGQLIPAEQDQAEEAPQPKVAIPDDMPGPKDPNCKTYRAWYNYAMAYNKRYGAPPLWNRTNAARISQVIEMVGQARAHKVAAFYVSMNARFYVQKMHPLNLLVNDCQSVAIQYETGRQMTDTLARQTDQTQSNLSGLDEAKRMMREMRAREQEVNHGS